MKNKIFAVILVLSFLLSGCASQKIPANDWLLEQHAARSDLEQASISISDLFSLYLIGSIEWPDFENELNLLVMQLQLSQAQYNETKKEIEPASHSYASKCGQEALDDAYKLTLDFLIDTVKEADTVQGITYRYLAWRDSFISEIATYLTAACLIEENENGGTG